MRNDPSKLANHVRNSCPEEKPSCLLIQANNRQTGESRSRARVKECKNRPISQISEFLDAKKGTGTALAFKVKSIGGTIPQPALIVRRGRRSTTLRRKEVENILEAGIFAQRVRRPLNRFTTIHFEAAKMSDPVWALGRLMKLAKDWLRTKGAVLSYIWVREAGEGKGDHVHILWHIPHELIRDFAMRERGWRKLIGAKPNKGAFKSVPVGLNYRHGAHEIQYGLNYDEALEGVLKYILKGVAPRSAEALGLARSGLGGELWGKRYGMSENINRTARAKSLK